MGKKVLNVKIQGLRQQPGAQCTRAASFKNYKDREISQDQSSKINKQKNK